MKMMEDGRIKISVSNGDGTYREVSFRSRVPVIPALKSRGQLEEQEGCSFLLYSNPSAPPDTYICS